MNPNNLIETIKSRIDCRDLFRRFWPTHYIERGSHSLCPFHDDKNPSLKLGQDKAHCFGACGQGWDAIDLYERGAKCTKADAIKALAAEIGIEAGRGGSRGGSPPNNATETPDFSARFEYLSKSPIPKEAIDYLQQKRGLSEGVVKLLRDKNLVAWSAKKKALAFPLVSPDRKLTVGIQYIPIDASKKTFAKGTNGKQACFFLDGKEGNLQVVTEAIIDALSVRSAFPDADVCSIMSASDPRKIGQIGFTLPVIFLDRDEAGQEATSKAVVELGTHVRVVDWTNSPQGLKDVNDLLRTGHSDVISSMIRNSRVPAHEQKTTMDVVNELAGREGEAAKETQAQKLIQLAATASLFHSPADECFALVPHNEHREVLPIRTKAFKQWLTRLFYMSEEKPPQTKALQETILLLEAKARFDGEEHPVYVRVAEHGGNVYLDLCNQSWEAVEITRNAWRVIPEPPIKFRRTRGMLPLPHPVHGGSLNDLRPFVNSPDDGAFRLLCAFLVQALSPSGPYPILNLEGEQGTGKSHTARVLRSLVDPSTAMLKTAPRDERDLMIAATNSWLLVFDNLSGVESWLSDALCRLSTGGGFSTRELYTNDEEIIFEATRPQILTGIDRISSRHDLIDRSIVAVLPVIPESERREEKGLWRELEAAKPRILGALCDAVSCALQNIEAIKLDRLPRMADFAKWVTAAEAALPWKPGEFMQAYTGNRSEAICLALDSDVVGCAVQQLMDSRGQWEGTPTELLAALRDLVSEDTRKLKTWPKAANSLTKRLRRMATFLRAIGIEIDLDGKMTDNTRTRIVTITKSLQKTVRTVRSVQACQQNLSDQEFSEYAHRTVTDDGYEVSDDKAENGEILPSDHKPSPDKDSDDPDDPDDKKHTLCNDIVNSDDVEYF